MMYLSYIAVDDEAIFLEELSEKLKVYPFLRETALIDDPFEAIQRINQTKPDVIFLDHDMPGLNGKEVLDQIKYKAQVIFVTSHLNPIQEVINHDGIATIQGYLNKPIDKEILKKICLKLNNTTESHHSVSSKIIIPNGKKEQLYIDPSDLSYLKADGKYTTWHFINRSPEKEVNLLLKDAKELLREKHIDFNEINRSYIVFENGIKMRRHKDLIVQSNDEEHEVGISEQSNLLNWIKKKFR